MTNTNAVASLIIAQDFKNIGIDVPASYADEIARIKSVYVSPDFRPIAVLKDLVVAALDAGRPLEADEKIRDIAVTLSVRNLGLGGIISVVSEEKFAAALTDHAGELFDALQDAFDIAAQRIEDAREQIGSDVDLLNPAVTYVNPDLSAVWTHAHVSVTTISLIVQAWKHITYSAGLVGGMLAEDGAFIVAEIPEELFDTRWNYRWPLNPKSEDIDNRQTDELSPIYRGLPLSLATPEEFTKRQRVRFEAHERIASGRKAAFENALKRGVR